MKAAMFFFMALAMAGLAQAAERDAVSCGTPLMTEAECARHQQTLAELVEPEARLAYLERHAAMLREREVMCGGAARRLVLARAQYR